MPCRRAAPRSTNTWWPWATASRTLPGAMPTRYSCTLISFGTPMRMKIAPEPRLAQFASPLHQDQLWLRPRLHLMGQGLGTARYRAAVGPVEQLDRVGDRNIHANSQLHDAADVTGRHRVGPYALDMGDLPVAQLSRKLRLQYVVGP